MTVSITTILWLFWWDLWILCMSEPSCIGPSSPNVWIFHTKSQLVGEPINDHTWRNSLNYSDPSHNHLTIIIKCRGFFSHGYCKHDKADKKKPYSNDKVNGQLFLCPSSFYAQSNFLNQWILQLKYKTDHYLLKIYLPIIIANLINFHNKTNVGQWNESRTWSHISFVIKNFLPIFWKRYCDNDKIEINYFKIPLFV